MILNHLLIVLRRRARLRHVKLHDLASTLLFVAFKRGRCVAGHIGDGVIFIRDGDGGVTVLSDPANGEFANATYFITDRHARRRLKLFHRTTIDRFDAMLASDGTAESLFDRKNKLAGPAVARLFDWARTLPAGKMQQILHDNLDRNFRLKSTDDCSIAMLTTG